MPPVGGSSGSRTALVTWSVVFAILWVTSSIIAIWAYAGMSKVQQTYDTQIKQYIPDVIADSDLNSDAVRQLKELRTTEGSGYNAQMPVFQVAMAEKDKMAQLLAGAGGKETAVKAAADALKAAGAAGKDAQVTVPTTDNVAGALTTVSKALQSSRKENKDLQSQLEAAKKQSADQVAQFEAQRNEMNKTLDSIRAEQQKQITDYTSYQQGKDASIGEIEKGRELERKAAADAQSAASVQVADLQRQLAEAKQKIDTLQNKFAGTRINTIDPITRASDGRIIRIPSKDIVYINIGSAESVTPGLTFEVYDKADGVPPIGDPSEEQASLPKGKASIEVLRVGNGSSECRITRVTPGTQLSEGDLVANLVYDPNIKYNFVVYGDFDMDRNGVATPQDAEIIKRLVTQWGGKLVDQVNVDTDFVVLGKEPVLPVFTAEELQDPFNAKKLADAQAALAAYQAVRTNAQNLHVPIVNQNRFLYLIGYYNQARR